MKRVPSFDRRLRSLRRTGFILARRLYIVTAVVGMHEEAPGYVRRYRSGRVDVRTALVRVPLRCRLPHLLFIHPSLLLPITSPSSRCSTGAGTPVGCPARTALLQAAHPTLDPISPLYFSYHLFHLLYLYLLSFFHLPSPFTYHPFLFLFYPPFLPSLPFFFLFFHLLLWAWSRLDGRRLDESPLVGPFLSIPWRPRSSGTTISRRSRPCDHLRHGSGRSLPAHHKRHLREL